MTSTIALNGRPSADKPSICFVAHNAYPIMARQRRLRFVGGAEVQQCLVARELARRGYPASIVGMDFGQSDDVEIDGVRIYKAYAPDAGLPGVRFVHPRMTSLWAAMRRADADVYYHRTAGMTVAILVAFCRMHGRRSIFAAAHDADFNVGPNELKYARDRVMYHWGVRRVDRIIVQSGRQLDLCRERYGRGADVIRSCYDHDGKPAQHSGPILWCATAKPHKRPHMFIELARRLPEYRFRLVGGPADGPEGARYYGQLTEQVKALANVEMTGFVPYADVEQHFDGACIFVNTSIGEGFPNTFLQAWARGIPTVSFFDPATTFEGRRVGAVVGSLDEMETRLRQLKGDADAWHQEAGLATRLVRRDYSIRGVGDAYEDILLRLQSSEVTS